MILLLVVRSPTGIRPATTFVVVTGQVPKSPTLRCFKPWSRSDLTPMRLPAVLWLSKLDAGTNHTNRNKEIAMCYGAYWPEASVPVTLAPTNEQPSSHTLVNPAQVQALVKAAAQHLNRQYQNQPITLCGVLTGSFMFVADLVRELADLGHIDLHIRFVGTQSYGKGTTSGNLSLTLWFGPEPVLSGRHLIFVEDIVDTGKTLQFLFEQTQARVHDQPLTVSAVALLNKPSRRQVSLTLPLWTAYEIPDHFVLGYGLDGADVGRQQPYIYYH